MQTETAMGLLVHIGIRVPKTISSNGSAMMAIASPAGARLVSFFSAGTLCAVVSPTGSSYLYSFLPRNSPYSQPPISAPGTLTIREYRINQPKFTPSVPATLSGPGVGMTRQCVVSRPTDNAVMYT